MPRRSRRCSTPAQTEIDDVGRAAALSKSDLVTSMVVEMTSLQGIMGEIYAQAERRTSRRGPGDPRALPAALLPAMPARLRSPGLALSLADKLDSLAGLFAVGAMPTGSADPFGLRRAALGIVNSLLASSTNFSIAEGLAEAAALQPVPVSDENLAESGQFVLRRLQGVLLDAGYPFDVVEAVLAVRGDNPVGRAARVQALAALVKQPQWPETFTAYARCARITRNLERMLALNPAAYVEQVEHDLHSAYAAAAALMQGAEESGAAFWATRLPTCKRRSPLTLIKCWSTPRTQRCASAAGPGAAHRGPARSRGRSEQAARLLGNRFFSPRLFRAYAPVLVGTF